MRCVFAASTDQCHQDVTLASAAHQHAIGVGVVVAAIVRVPLVVAHLRLHLEEVRLEEGARPVLQPRLGRCTLRNLQVIGGGQQITVVLSTKEDEMQAASRYIQQVHLPWLRSAGLQPLHPALRQLEYPVQPVAGTQDALST